jgi:ribonuclease Z
MIDNVPFESRNYRGLTLQGYSRAGIQNYWRIPELKIAFDLALLPWSFTDTPMWFITHAHLDHLLALPALLTRRRMMGLMPPCVYVPAEIVEDVRELLKCWERLDKGEESCFLTGVRPGDEIELPSKHRVRVFQTFHTVPSCGYLVFEPRRKLKAEFQSVAGSQLQQLREQGTEISEEILYPLFAYTGDTSDEVFDANPILFETRILLIEMTFLQQSPSPETAHRHGHLHLQDFLDRAERFQNEKLLATHFSSRYEPEEVRTILSQKLPECLKSRVEPWIG